jgi:hypothetical protein
VYRKRRADCLVLDVPCKAPAGDVPIRSVSLASDGSCLVAGNNKVSDLIPQRIDRSHAKSLFRANVMSGKSTTRSHLSLAIRLSRSLEPIRNT